MLNLRSGKSESHTEVNNILQNEADENLTLNLGFFSPFVVWNVGKYLRSLCIV